MGDYPYTPPKVGDEHDGMRWTGTTWAPICPADDTAMTVHNTAGELCCPTCGVSYLQRVRGSR